MRGGGERRGERWKGGERWKRGGMREGGEGGVIGGVRGGERVSENLISGMDGLITYQHPITCSSVVTHVKSFSHSPI